MIHEQLSGLLIPALTPFAADLTPDADAFVSHCNWLIQHGGDGLAVFGTTSEANSLSMEERMRLLDALIDSGMAPQRLLPGTGTCAVPDTVRLTRHATEHGCGGVLMLPPFYYKGVTDEGLFSYFSQVIDEVGHAGLRIYLYHIPPMSSVPFSLPLIERLAKGYPDVVVGIKDSGGDWPYTESLLENFPQLSVFPGSEAFLLDGLRHGAAGCITASGNVNPGGIRALIDNWRRTDADQLQAGLTGVRKVVQSFPMIPALKAILADHRDDAGWLRVRPPLRPLAEADRRRLLAELQQVGFRAGTGIASDRAVS